MTTPHRVTEDDQKVTTDFGTLVSIYLDGVLTGIASFVASAGASDDLAVATAKQFQATFGSDPAAVETFREQVRERLSGDIDHPPVRLDVYGGRDR